MKKITYLILLLSLSISATAQDRKLILVTIDGLRWQEVFQGIQPDIANNTKYTPNKTPLIKELETLPANKAKQKLMPFLWQTIAEQGVIIGNRNKGSVMSVSNRWNFSYPGYSEIFTGVTNPKLNSNAKVNNPEISFLEWLQNHRNYKNVAVFGGWDVFPYILNTQRSRLHVNAGFASEKGTSAKLKLLNQLQTQIPSPWTTVRLDAFTHHYALEHLKTHKPKVMAISYGETDDFAHDGRYDHYISATRRTDNFIKDLWQQLQSLPEYKNNTNILIVTDHGRGSAARDWMHHASKASLSGYMKKLKPEFPQGIVGSEHIWMAAIGPDIKSIGDMPTAKELKQNQIAATALTLLNESFKAFNPKAGKPILEIIK
ncbi:phosphoglyceromutase [Parashewanella curva]|uniref:Phosphoglyceromutase n=1 Tax=Parashewanella curva TaxID=2338552 RepID=A0A3L8PV18_9GAMM|nr:alkaline phosphatase family protein [Parashewanella curva]RLV59154.1 phosphoglyceromutase [Parashewanella curva]